MEFIICMRKEMKFSEEKIYISEISTIYERFSSTFLCIRDLRNANKDGKIFLLHSLIENHPRATFSYEWSGILHLKKKFFLLITRIHSVGGSWGWGNSKAIKIQMFLDASLPKENILCSHLSSRVLQWFNKRKMRSKSLENLFEGWRKSMATKMRTNLLIWHVPQRHEIIKHRTTHDKTRKNFTAIQNPTEQFPQNLLIPSIGQRDTWTWTKSTRKESGKNPIFQVSDSCFLTFWHIKVEWRQTRHSEASRTWNRFQLCLH